MELPSSTSYRIARSVLGMGGGTKTSASYRVQGTSGQLSGAGVLAGSSYRVRSGFWAGMTCPLAEFAAAPDISVNGAIVTLEWNAVAGASSYRIYRGAEPYFVLGTPYDTTSKRRGLILTEAGIHLSITPTSSEPSTHVVSPAHCIV